MATNEVLEERLNNMLEENKKEHKQIMQKLDSINHKLENLDQDFPTRIEFKVAQGKIQAIENVLKGAGGTVGLAILAALLKLVIK